MRNDRRWEWAAAVAAEILNLHWGKDAPKCELFQKLQASVYGGMCMAAMEETRAMLEPSKN